MGLFSIAKRTTGGLMTVARGLNKVPVLRAVPGLGTALTVAGGLATVSSMVGGRGGGGMPALPGAGGMGLPGMGAPGMVGSRSIFRNDPNIVAALQPWAISKGNLRVSYRSPIKGYVIRYDSAGDPYAIPKNLARQYLGWKAAKKPPLSVGDWQAIKRADGAVKKVRKIMTTVARVDKAVNRGRVKVKGGKSK